jgi:phospholipid-translocating ATPase
LHFQVDSFAQAGLRTLLVGVRRNLPKGEVEEWLKKHKIANTLIGGAKTDALTLLAEEMEVNLELIGATAIEDALQEGTYVYLPVSFLITPVVSVQCCFRSNPLAAVNT